jgi:hypothetical protein
MIRSVSILMVVHRMVSYIFRSSKRSGLLIKRILILCVALTIFLDCMGLIANVAVSVYNVQVAQEFTRAANTWNTSKSQSGANTKCIKRAHHHFCFVFSTSCIYILVLESDLTFAPDLHAAEAFKLFGTASFALLFQNWAELLTLMIIATVFIFVTPLSAFFLHKAHQQFQAISKSMTTQKQQNPNSDLALQIIERAADDTFHQKLRIFTTCAFVILGCVPRLAFDSIQAYANIDTHKSQVSNCGQCDACQSTTW